MHALCTQPHALSTRARGGWGGVVSAQRLSEAVPAASRAMRMRGVTRRRSPDARAERHCGAHPKRQGLQAGLFLWQCLKGFEFLFALLLPLINPALAGRCVGGSALLRALAGTAQHELLPGE